MWCLLLTITEVFHIEYFAYFFAYCLNTFSNKNVFLTRHTAVCSFYGAPLMSPHHTLFFLSYLLAPGTPPSFGESVDADYVE